ncbi:MAG: methyltransferase domain-containing protein [Candidatus Acidiferrales bacterium]
MSTNPEIAGQISSPDENAAGFVRGAPDPLRYEGHIMDPDEVAGIIAGMIPEGARVLDVGCGTGSMDEILVDACRAEIVGIEPDPTRAARARSRGFEVHVGYLSKGLIGEIGSFDVVLFADVLEHLPNPQAMLLLARESLKPRGSVIVSVPNVAHWSVRVDLLRGRFEYQDCGIRDATHLRWFTAASAKSLLAFSGFKVTEYRGAANPRLADNVLRRPLRWLPANHRKHFLRLACRSWPGLFAVQHVVKAEVV